MSVRRFKKEEGALERRAAENQIEIDDNGIIY